MARIERVGGQVDSIGRFLTTAGDCADGLALLANLHGGINNLMAEVSENHILQHVMGQEKSTMSSAELAEDLIGFGTRVPKVVRMAAVRVKRTRRMQRKLFLVPDRGGW